MEFGSETFEYTFLGVVVAVDAVTTIRDLFQGLKMWYGLT